MHRWLIAGLTVIMNINIESAKCNSIFKLPPSLHIIKPNRITPDYSSAFANPNRSRGLGNTYILQTGYMLQKKRQFMSLPACFNIWKLPVAFGSKIRSELNDFRKLNACNRDCKDFLQTNYGSMTRCQRPGTPAHACTYVSSNGVRT